MRSPSSSPQSRRGKAAADCTHIFARREAQAPETGEDVALLEKQLGDLKARWPAHSASPSMLEKLEEFEEKLENARRRVRRGDTSGIRCPQFQHRKPNHR